MGGVLGSVWEVTDQTFNAEVLKSTMAVLVDFWAEWCGPCRALAPVVERMATEYCDRLKVCKLNVDDNQVTAERYGVMSLPVLLVFKDGQPVQRLDGAIRNIDNLRSRLRCVL